jgi:WD40 repeat protein
VASGFKAVSLRDADTMQPLGRLDQPSPTVTYRPNGSQIAIVASPSPPLSVEVGPLPILLVDATTFEQERTQLGGQPRDGIVEDLRYSANGRFLVASFDTGSVAVWDVTAAEEPIWQIDLPTTLTTPTSVPIRAIHNVALSPAGGLLYVGTAGPPSVTVYRVATGQRLRSARVPGAELDIEINPAGSLLAVAAANDIVLLDAGTLTERGRLVGHTAPVSKLRFSHDGSLLASASHDRTAIVWDVATGNRREQLRGHATSVGDLAFSPDDATLYTASEGHVLAWDLDGARRLTSRDAIAEPVAEPVANPDSNPGSNPELSHPVSSAPSGDAVAYLKDTQSGLEPRTTVQWLDLTTGKAGEVIDTGQRSIYMHTWRPDGRRFATGGAGVVQVWDWQTGELVAERYVAQPPITGLDYIRDGTQLMVVSSAFMAGSEIRTIDAETLTIVRPPLRLEQRIRRMFASPDNRTAIALTRTRLEAGEPTEDFGIALVDIVDGRLLHERPLAGAPSYADFSPDGQRVAVSYTDRIGVLDVDSGEWLRPPVDGHEGAVTSLAFAPDGAVVASGGSDGRVGLWDGQTGSLLGTVLPGQPNIPVTVEFLPDGHTLQIASLDGAVYTWDTRPQHWVEHACTVVGRNLTQEEWRDTFGDRRYHRTCPDYPAGE